MNTGSRVSFLAGVLVLFLMAASESAAQIGYVCGDVNGDGRVDLADLEFLSNYLRFAGPAPSDPTKGDVDVSGGVDTSDLEYLSRYLLFQGPPPLCYPSYRPSTDDALPGGTYCFYDFIVPPGVTVEVLDDVVINVLHAFVVDTGAFLIGNCKPILINHNSRLESLRLLGTLLDTCQLTTDTARVIIRSTGNMQFGGTRRRTGTRIKVSGPLSITDPWCDQLSADTITYTNTNENGAQIPPVCNLTAEFTSPTNVSFTSISKLPFAGTITRRTLLFGDGDSVDDPPGAVVHTYTPGTYQPRLKVTAGADSSVCWLTIVVPDQKVYEGKSSPFNVDSLQRPVGIAFGMEATGARMDSLRWDFGDGDTASQSAVQHVFQSPGRYRVLLTCFAGDSRYTSGLVVYAQMLGSQQIVAPPACPVVTVPPCAEAIPPSSPPLPVDVPCVPPTSSECGPCNDPDWEPPIDAVEQAPGIVAFGDLSLDVWMLTTLFHDATLVFKGMSYAGQSGAAGAAGNEVGENGKSGETFLVATMHGKIIICDAEFSPGDGGAGGNAQTPNPGDCPAKAQGGKGGNVGPIALWAPEGSIHYCGPVTIHLADGGNGGTAHAIGDTPLWFCDDGCVADATGGDGGWGGGGIWNLSNRVYYSPGFRVRFSGVSHGGDGGDALADATSGAPCLTCGDWGGRGGSAYSRGGHGGSSFWWFVGGPCPPADSLFTSQVENAFNIGAGGWVRAWAGDGGSGIWDCCPTKQPGVNGGVAGDVFAWPGSGAPSGDCWNLIQGSGGDASDGRPPGRGGWDGWCVPPFGGAACCGWPFPMGHGADGQPCAPVVLWLYFSNIPVGPIGIVPPKIALGTSVTTEPVTFHLNLYADSTTDSGLIGTAPVTFMGTEQYAAISGDNAHDPAYAKDSLGFVHVSHGGMVFRVDSLPGGRKAFGGQATVDILPDSGAGEVHLAVYRGGVKIGEAVGDSFGINVLRFMDDTGHVTADSILVWGPTSWDFFHWWIRIFDDPASDPTLTPPEADPLWKEERQ